VAHWTLCSCCCSSWDYSQLILAAYVLTVVPPRPKVSIESNSDIKLDWTFEIEARSETLASRLNLRPKFKPKSKPLVLRPTLGPKFWSQNWSCIQAFNISGTKQEVILWESMGTMDAVRWPEEPKSPFCLLSSSLDYGTSGFNDK